MGAESSLALRLSGSAIQQQLSSSPSPPEHHLESANHESILPGSIQATHPKSSHPRSRGGGRRGNVFHDIMRHRHSAGRHPLLAWGWGGGGLGTQDVVTPAPKAPIISGARDIVYDGWLPQLPQAELTIPYTTPKLQDPPGCRYGPCRHWPGSCLAAASGASPEQETRGCLHKCLDTQTLQCCSDIAQQRALWACIAFQAQGGLRHLGKEGQQE